MAFVVGKWPVDWRLFPGIVNFYPIAVGVLEVNLFYAVHPNLNCLWFAGHVFIGNGRFVQFCDKGLDRRHTETEVMVLGMVERAGNVLNEVQVALGADGKPSVPAVAKGFGDGVEADEVLIEGGTFLQVLNGEGNVVDDGFLCAHRNGYCEKKAEGTQIFHVPAL